MITEQGADVRLYRHRESWRDTRTQHREGGPISVAEATDADVAAFATFFREAWKQAGPGALGFVGASDQVIAELTAPEAVLERIGGPDRRMFLAWEGGRVVGFAATKRIDAATVELAGIIVLQTMAGGGVGTRLVEEALNSARGEGYRKMIVRTETTNERARAFYERRGFIGTGSTTEQVEGTAVEVWELAREISSSH
ncbi:MAG: GNAT family N-acetyltransferase [Acidimicrobiia bacterium]